MSSVLAAEYGFLPIFAEYLWKPMTSSTLVLVDDVIDFEELDFAKTFIGISISLFY